MGTIQDLLNEIDQEIGRVTSSGTSSQLPPQFDLDISFQLPPIPPPQPQPQPQPQPPSKSQQPEAPKHYQDQLNVVSLLASVVKQTIGGCKCCESSTQSYCNICGLYSLYTEFKNTYSHCQKRKREVEKTNNCGKKTYRRAKKIATPDVFLNCQHYRKFRTYNGKFCKKSRSNKKKRKNKEV